MSNLGSTATKYLKYYESGFWTEEMLKNAAAKAVEKGKMSAEEYEAIVGKAYQE